MGVASTRRGRTTRQRDRWAQALARGVEFLLRARDRQGWWRDFRLAPGPSDEWATAYVAALLAGSGQAAARPAVARAWTLLAGCHTSIGGWGYNALTPCDADSTAWALRVAAAAGAGGSPRARAGHAFLGAHARGDGGIATYADEAPVRAFTGLPRSTALTGWTSSHACVTAAVAALPPYRERLRPFLRARQHADGAWRAYWWGDHGYATALAADALAHDPGPGDTERVARAVAWARDRAARALPPFDLAWCIWLLARAAPAGDPAVTAGADRLAGQQRADGSWAPSARLRVPQPGDRDPERAVAWEPGGRTEGAVVVDRAGVFTTATAVHALAAALDRARGPRPAARR